MHKTNDTVAHKFANKIGQSLRSGNIFFENKTIYSYGYHYPIATFVRDNYGVEHVLFNECATSMTTNKHKISVRRALGYNYIGVLTLQHNTILRHYDEQREHSYNTLSSSAVADWRCLTEDLINELCVKISKAKGRRAEYANELSKAVETFNHLNRLFGNCLPLEIPADYVAHVADLLARQKETARLAQLEREQKFLVDQQKIKEWLNGAPIRAPHTAAPYVRVKDNTLQTSYGVVVPLKRALAIYRLAKKCAAKKVNYTPKKRQSIGDYRLDCIDREGTVRAGCHTLPLKVQSLGAKLAGL